MVYAAGAVGGHGIPSPWILEVAQPPVGARIHTGVRAFLGGFRIFPRQPGRQRNQERRQHHHPHHFW